ncbi:MAG: multicomponent Na+:H+ antiporter subunit E [Lentisphaeria bacterium]|jgi:multicomponent Na+:H+ antiporter subunit E
MIRHTLYLFLGLCVFWLLNSNHYTPLILSLGLASIVFVIYIAHRMDVIDHESLLLNLHWTKVPGYILWLLKEVVVANLVVVKHIWLGNKSISPTFSPIHAGQKTDVGKVIYANSITMTPGTVTLDVTGDIIMVHSLLKENIDALEAGEMNRRVCELEIEC